MSIDTFCCTCPQSRPRGEISTTLGFGANFSLFERSKCADHGGSLFGNRERTYVGVGRALAEKRPRSFKLTRKGGSRDAAARNSEVRALDFPDFPPTDTRSPFSETPSDSFSILSPLTHDRCSARTRLPRSRGAA